MQKKRIRTKAEINKIENRQSIENINKARSCFLEKIQVNQIRSIAQSCPTLCDPMNRSTPGLPVQHQLLEFTETHVHRVSDAIQHLILCHPLLLLPPIPPSIRVFSNESTLRMRWPKDWSFTLASFLPKKSQG